MATIEKEHLILYRDEKKIQDELKAIREGETAAEIVERNTFYALSIEDKKAYDEATKVLNQVRELYQKTGYSMILQGAVAYGSSKNSEEWIVDPPSFCKQRAVSKIEELGTFLTAKEVCQLLNISRRTLVRWKKKGVLIPKRFTTRVRYQSSDVLKVKKTNPKYRRVNQK